MPDDGTLKPSSLPRLPGNSNRTKEIIQDLQFALLVIGYYAGDIDGIFDDETRQALIRFQVAAGLPVTGTMTPETMDRLNVLVR